MTLIKDTLAAYYAPTAPGGGAWPTDAARIKYETLILGSALNDAMNTLAKDDDGWGWFNWYWRKFDGRSPQDIYTPVHADILIAAAGELGFTDTEPLVDWVAGMKVLWTGKLPALDKAESDLVLPYDSYKDVSFDVLKSAIMDPVNKGGFTLDCQWHATDDLYKLLTLDAVKAILRVAPQARFKYISERRDCEDYTTMFIGWLDSLGYGNASVGNCEINLLLADGTAPAAHDVVIVVYDDNGTTKAGFIEAQTNTLYSLDAVWVGGGVSGAYTGNQIRWVLL